jgi:hypothetical protein
MRQKVSCSLILLIAVSLFASAAVSDLEADVLYKAGELYFQSHDYQNSLIRVYRARAIYEQTNNSWGMQRCEQLIGQVEANLEPIKLADIYYNVAGDYYLENQNDLDNLRLVISMAQKAKSKYAISGGTDGAAGQLKSDDLINNAQNVINTIFNKCVRDGDDLRGKAQDSLFAEEYIVSKGYALNASAKYTSCAYQPGIDAVSSLLTTINGKIQNIQVQAKASYDRAVQYYTQNTQESRDKCIEYATESQSLYKKILESQGESSAATLVSKCKQESDEFDDLRVKEALGYFDEAKRLSIIPDCINSTLQANKAKAIFQEFYNKAYNKEYKLPRSEQVKIRLFDAYLNDVNSMIARVMEACNVKTMMDIAEGFYRKSQDFYLNNNLQEALTYANNARNIFVQYKDFVGISKCDTLIDQINIRFNQQKEAETYMKVAQDNYNIAEFDEARVNANKAKTIYSAIYDKDTAQVVESFLGNVSESEGKLSEANLVFSKAKDSFDAKRYEESANGARNARTLYISVNYTFGVAQSEMIISEGQDLIDKANADFRNKVLMFGVLFILSAVLIVSFVTRRKAVETDYQKRVGDDEEKLRRHEEEWSIRSEEETKTKVEDELRKLVESERTKIDET